MEDYEKEYINGCIDIIESCEPLQRRINRAAVTWSFIYGSMIVIILGMTYWIIKYFL